MSLIFPKAFPHLPSDLKSALRAFEQGPFATVARNLEAFEARPAIDCIETEKDFAVYADVPGVDKKDISLAFSEDGTTLTLSGTVKPSWSAAHAPADDEASAKEKAPESHCSERFVGSFSRSLRFPAIIDPSQTKANLKDGVLVVTVPKKQVSEARNISIE